MNVGPARTDAAFLADKAAQQWSHIIASATSAAPVNIDGLLVGANTLAAHAMGAARFSDMACGASLSTADNGARPVIAVMLPDRDERTSAKDAHLLAVRYAALAIEKECDIVILSHQDNAGFESFGFRVERIAGESDTERANCLAQLQQFWGFEIVI